MTDVPPILRIVHDKAEEARGHIPPHDPVESPRHYTRGGIECIDYIEAKGLDYCTGNAVKYLSRAGHKGDELEDLRKAQWYIARRIAQLERSKPA